MNSIYKCIAMAVLCSVMGITSAHAVNPEEILDDTQLEERARDISSQLRCLVCQNQSIDGSDAELARDLRVLVRERLVAGDSNDEVFSFVVDRYGEFVLLRPRFSVGNAALWATPLLVLLLGLFGFRSYAKDRQTVSPSAPLTQDEQARLAKILDEGDRDKP